MVKKNSDNRKMSDNRGRDGLELFPGENYMQYNCCVHIFEGTEEKTALVQCNQKTVLEKISTDLKTKYVVKSDSKTSSLLQVNYQSYEKMLGEVERIVKEIIAIKFDNTRYVLKFYEKNGNPGFVDMNHPTTIIVW